MSAPRFSFDSSRNESGDDGLWHRMDAAVDLLAGDDLNDSSEIICGDTPHAVQLPDGYVASYAYPVVVWLHQPHGDESQIHGVLPQISERNYIGIAPRGNVAADAGWTWSTEGEGINQILNNVLELLDGLEQYCMINRERIFIAGYGLAGSVAMEVMLARPDVFRGSAMLCSRFPEIPHPLAKFRLLRGRQVLMATALDAPKGEAATSICNGRLLYTAGMQVATRVYQSGGRGLTTRMLRDIDHWIMSGIATAIRA